MIEALSAYRADQSLNERILPKGSRSGYDLLDTHVLDPLAEEVAVDGIAIAYQEAGRYLFGKRFDHLLGRPLRRSMRSGVTVDDHAAVMAEYDETEQDPKRRGRHREEVDCHHIANAVIQEGPPRLRRRLAVADSVLRHSCLRRLVAKVSEFRLDSWGSPERILPRHATDESPHLGIDLRSTDLAEPRLPPPVQPEALPMPTDDRFRLDDDEDGAPIRPEAGQPSPEDPVALPEPRPFRALLQDRDLLPEGEVLGGQLGAISHDVSNQYSKDVKRAPFRGLPGC